MFIKFQIILHNLYFKMNEFQKKLFEIFALGILGSTVTILLTSNNLTIKKLIQIWIGAILFAVLVGYIITDANLNPMVYRAIIAISALTAERLLIDLKFNISKILKKLIYKNLEIEQDNESVKKIIDKEQIITIDKKDSIVIVNSDK